MQVGKSNISFTALIRKTIHEETPPCPSDKDDHRIAGASNGNEFWVTKEDIPVYDALFYKGIRTFGTQDKIDQFIRERRDGKLE